MRIENVLRFSGSAGASGLFFATGSFGVINGDFCERNEEGGVITYRCCRGEIELNAVFTGAERGVMMREDFFTNHSKKPVTLTALSSRFVLDGNAYEVYTQYNAWQHESRGGWQSLVTQVSAAAEGIRTCDGAAPMMALHNVHSGCNTVFHLLPNAQWKMTARKVSETCKELVVVETGFYNEAMQLTVAAGETIALPTVIFFTAQNKTDLDAYKLHEWYNRRYPRKALPVTYNSWLYCFDALDIDALKTQADCAADLGIEAFMIDAGWFGDGTDWSSGVGDWIENTQSGPCGRLRELSDHVRNRGMIFGLWFEPERADPACEAVKAHPDYYINGTLLDFANPAAVSYITEVIAARIETYHIGWVKFDFNATIPLDPSGNAFYRYMQGQKRFVESLRERFPHLRITNCASGGYRMELGQGTLCDSFWLSDNQGPYEGIRIVKDTLKRMPTALIERWNVQRYCDGFPRYDHKEPVGVMFSCNNATWDFIISVDDSFTKQFIDSGPIGFSHDLTAMPPAYKEAWKEHIARFKEEREFYREATARILIDTEDIVAIQYADYDLSRIVMKLFTKNTCAKRLLVSPAVDISAEYLVNGNRMSGAELAEDGIAFENLEDNRGYTAELWRA